MRSDTEETTARLSETIGPDVAGTYHGPLIAGAEPPVEATPRSVDECALVIARAAALGAAIVPSGGGSKLSIGNPPRRVDLLLRTNALDRIVEYDPENLVITLEAGTTIDNVQSRVLHDGLHLPVDPPMPWRTTIGGMLACNVHGPKRLSHGSLRDLLLGAKVALVDGSIVRFGGRTVKNVSGYDIAKLFVGSLGTLGVIVEATFRLRPISVEEHIALVSLADVEEASRFFDVVSHSVLLPSALELLSPQFSELVLGQENVDRANTRGYLFMIGLEGHPKAVARQVGVVADIHTEISACRVAPVDDYCGEPCPGPAWRRIAGAPEVMLMAGYRVSARVSAPRSRILSIAQQAERHSASSSVIAAYRVSCGTGTAEFWFNGEAGAVTQVLHSLRSSAERDGGALVLTEGWSDISEGFDGWGQERAEHRLMQAIKDKFDPRHLLNPGRFVGGV